MFYLNLSIAKLLRIKEKKRVLEILVMSIISVEIQKVENLGEKDLEKRLKAEENRYKVYTVWESDIKNSEEISKLKVLYYANR